MRVESSLSKTYALLSIVTLFFVSTAVAFPSYTFNWDNVKSSNVIDSPFFRGQHGSSPAPQKSMKSGVVPNEYIVRLQSADVFAKHMDWLNKEISKANVETSRLKKRAIAGLQNQFGEKFLFEFPESTFTNSSKVSNLCYYQGVFSPEMVRKIKDRPEVISVVPNRYIGFDSVLNSQTEYEKETPENIVKAEGDGSASGLASPQGTDKQRVFEVNSFYASNAENKLLKDDDQKPRSNEQSQTQPANWGLDRIDQRYLPLNGEYDYVVAGGANVDVYVLDSGVREDHVDFGGRAKNVFCAISPCEDDSGHGTHVAGIIGSATYGVAKSARINAIKVLNGSGYGSEQNVIRGLQYIASQVSQSTNKCVINISSGTSSVNEMILHMLDVIVQQLDCVVVVAAGNEDSNACEITPANSKSVVVVGNVDSNDLKWRTSNWGPCVTLFAPGVQIRSLYSTSNTASATMTGTSMSAPFVTGVVAVHRSMFPEHRAYQIHQLLQLASTPKVVDGIEMNWFFRQFPWNWGREETINRVLYSRLYETFEL